MNNAKTTLTTATLMLAMLVLVPAPAQADPLSDATTTIKQTQYAAAETAEDTTDSIEENAIMLKTKSIEYSCRAKLVPVCDHPNGSPGECNEDPNNIECVCARYPQSPGCTGERMYCFHSGQQDWDTDRDGVCDAEDFDDDGDGVPDCWDPTNDPNPVDGTYNYLIWWSNGQPNCP